MKHIIFLMTFAAGMWSGSKTKIDANLKQQLQQMYTNDQYILNHGEKPAKLKIGKDSLIVTWDTLEAIHRRSLWKIFKQHGYPDYNLVDTSGADHFWLLVQHQDSDTILQKQVLAAMSIKVKQGLASKKFFAYLTDRVLVNTGHKQIYGTQMRTDRPHAKNEPKPIEDSAIVDKLRHEAGLDSLNTYVRFMNSFYIDSAGNIYYR